MLLGKKILVIIPSRSKSKGLKNKNIRKINSTPLLGLTGIFTSKLKFVDECVISTDSLKYQKIAAAYNINSYFLRPAYLSGPLISDIEVIDHALEFTEKYNREKYDVVVYLQPTSPLRRKNDITKAVKHLINNNLDSVWSVSQVDKKFHPLKILKKEKNNSFKFYMNKGKNIIARQQLEDVFLRNGVFYILNARSFKKNKSLIGKNNFLYLIKHQTFNIDNLEDFNNFEKYYNDKIKEKNKSNKI
jgi:CMP-N,N'-diacetyllegionaminic acid synthase